MLNPAVVLALVLPSTPLAVPSIQQAKFDSSITNIHLAGRHAHVVLTGTLSNINPAHAYRFQAKKGSRLHIDLAAIGKGGVVPMYHIQFPGGALFGMKGYDPFDGKLTQNGVYILTVEANQMASNGLKGRYRLTLSR